MQIIGIIAGGGKSPILAARSAKDRGYSVAAVAYQDETDPQIEEVVDQIQWLRLGQFGKLIKTLKGFNVQKALMIGTIKKRRMFKDIRPDLRGLRLISKLSILHDDNILRAVADEIESEGIEIVGIREILPELIAPEGVLTERRPDKREMEDIRLGWKVAKELGRLDIGQCVVVNQKVVVAVEAIEGTDETIKRGGRLSGRGAVVVKVCKPLQDHRFDLPTVGKDTIEIMKDAGASALSVEAGRTLIFDMDEMIAFANDSGISIISMKEE